jgi:hypothetical protein
MVWVVIVVVKERATAITQFAFSRSVEFCRFRLQRPSASQTWRGSIAINKHSAQSHHFTGASKHQGMSATRCTIRANRRGHSCVLIPRPAWPKACFFQSLFWGFCGQGNVLGWFLRSEMNG